MNASPAAPLLDPDNPWPGLASYGTEGAAFFHGREAETAALLRLVQTSPATVLMGASGLGKTSLLRAGLIPRLLEYGGWPVFLRPDWQPEAPSLTEQILQQTALAAAAHGIEMPVAALRPGASLWEFFHHRQADFWSHDHQLTTPVILLDQFEEAFTLGTAVPERQAELKEILVSLTTHRCPEAVRLGFGSGQLNEADFDFRREGCCLLLSLREDFAAALEDWRRDIPALGTHRLRLLPLQAETATAVLEATGHHLLEPGTAAAIVKFVSDRGAGLGEEVSPPLLNIVARELNLRRQAAGLARISAAMLESTGQDILEDFYRRSFEGLGETARSLVEDHLLTTSGYRNLMALDDALLQPGITRDTLDLLIHRRLLRSDDRSGIPRLELTHDLLLPIASRSREERVQQQRLAAAAGREATARREKARLLRLAGAMGLLSAVALAAAGFAFHQWRAATAAARQATEARDAAEPLVEFLLGDQFEALEATGRISLMEQTATETEGYLQRLPGPLQRTAPSIRLRLRRSQNLDRLGQLPEAIAEARASVELASTLSTHPELLPESLAQLGNLLPRQSGALPEALDVCRRALALYPPLIAKAPEDETLPVGQAKARIHLGEALRETGDYDGALFEFSAALAGLPDSSLPRVLELRCLALMDMADALSWQRRHEQAAVPLEEGLTLLKRFRAIEPGNYRWISWSVDFLLRNAENENSRGYSENSIEPLETALDLHQPLCALDPRNAAWQKTLLTLQVRLGQSAFLAGDTGKAAAVLTDAVSLLDKLWTPADQDPLYSTIAMETGQLHFDLRAPAAGALLFTRALEANRQAARTGEPEALRRLIVSGARLAKNLTAAGDAAGAVGGLETAREARRRISPHITDSSRAAWAFDDAGLAQIEGDWHLLKKEPVPARRAYQQALEIAAGLLSSHAGDADALQIFLDASESLLATGPPPGESAAVCLEALTRLRGARAAGLNTADHLLRSAEWLVRAAVHRQKEIPSWVTELRGLAGDLPEDGRPDFWESTGAAALASLPSPGAALVRVEALLNLPSTPERLKELQSAYTQALPLGTIAELRPHLESTGKGVAARLRTRPVPPAIAPGLPPSPPRPGSSGSSRVGGGDISSEYVPSPVEATATPLLPNIKIRPPARR